MPVLKAMSRGKEEKVDMCDVYDPREKERPNNEVLPIPGGSVLNGGMSRTSKFWPDT